VAAYRLSAAAARARMADAATDWRTPPPGVPTVAAPRAYVHDWSDYRRHERRDMLPLLPAGARQLLDIGGGEGAFARLAERERALQAWLLEPDATAAAAARAQGLRVLACRLEDAPAAPPAGSGIEPAPASPALAPSADPAALPANGFDAVTMLDVLEHLADPVAALRAVRRWLAPGGALIVSTPNLGHWPLVRDLAAGRFDRLPVGTLCCTHLHFFTPATLRQTLAQAGFAIEHEVLAGADDPLPDAAAEAALRAWIDTAAAAGVALDRRSLRTETLRVRARLAAVP
jgi:SAM-dependent methyltransferase